MAEAVNISLPPDTAQHIRNAEQPVRDSSADWDWTLISADDGALCIFSGPYYRREEWSEGRGVEAR